MLSPNQGMGRRFIILACSNYLIYKKTSGRWDEFLKPNYQFPQTFLVKNMDDCLLSGPPENPKQYYLTCNYANFFSMMFVSFDGRGPCV
jgi:hypothetical protein